MSLHDVLVSDYSRWLRLLARDLVGQAHDADDLAQDALVAAIERPPARRDNVRGWLRTVLLNRHRVIERGRRRRRQRERDVARHEVTDPDEATARAARHREVVEAVVGLDEPFRTTVLLRYFDGLPPREIAAQLGIAVATVHSRLHRALERLRMNLDRRHHGDRGAWAGGLLTLADRGRPWAAPAIGAMIMSTKSKLWIGAAAAIVGLTALWLSSGEVPVADGPPITGGEAPGQLDDRIADDARIRRHAVESATANGRTDPSRTAEPTVSVRGRVLDTEAAPRAGVPIEFSGSRDVSARSDVAGDFEIEIPDVDGKLAAARSSGLETVLASMYVRGTSRDLIIVVADRIAIGGEVTDATGQPIAGAALSIAFEPDFLARFDDVLDTTWPGSWAARTDATGRFAFAEAPRSARALLETRAAGFATDARRVPDFPDDRLQIVLDPTTVDADAIRGQVVDADERPVAGAFVAIGPNATTRSDADGNFALELAAGDELLAVKSGHLPGRLLADGTRRGRARWPDRAIVRLGGEPLTLSGRVVDRRGRPLSDARVWLADPGLFGLVDGMPARIENLLIGAAGTAELRSRAASLGPGTDPVEVMNSTTDMFFGFVVTDSDGGFTLPGLLPNSYRLGVMDGASLVRGEFGPYQAGERGIEIVLNRDHCHEEVAGRVVSRRGEPIPGVTVIASTEVVRARFPFRVELVFGDTSVSEGPDGIVTDASRSAFTGRTTTDAQGRFSIRRLAKADVTLFFRGDRIVSRGYRLTATDDPQNLEIVAELRMHARVELAETDSANRFEVVDIDGRRVPIREVRGLSENATRSMRLDAGKSRVFSLSEDAAAIVFYRDAREVRRQPLALHADGITVVR